MMMEAGQETNKAAEFDPLLPPIFQQLGIETVHTAKFGVENKNELYRYTYTVEMDFKDVRLATVERKREQRLGNCGDDSKHINDYSASSSTASPSDSEDEDRPPKSICVKFVLIHNEMDTKRMVHFYDEFQPELTLREVLEEYVSEMRVRADDWKGEEFAPRFAVCKGSFNKENSYKLNTRDLKKTVSEFVDPLWGNRTTIVCDCRYRKKV